MLLFRRIIVVYDARMPEGEGTESKPYDKQMFQNGPEPIQFDASMLKGKEQSGFWQSLPLEKISASIDHILGNSLQPE